MKTLRKLWKSRNSAKIYIDHQKRNIKIDKDLIGYVTVINKDSKNYRTLACCSGHGIYPPTIVVKHFMGIYELFSGIRIPRKKDSILKTSKASIIFLRQYNNHKSKPPYF